MSDNIVYLADRSELPGELDPEIECAECGVSHPIEDWAIMLVADLGTGVVHSVMRDEDENVMVGCPRCECICVLDCGHKLAAGKLTLHSQDCSVFWEIDINNGERDD